MEKIYLAGKIDGNDYDWRVEFVPEARGTSADLNSGFPETICGSRGTVFIYMGPYFYGKTHGALHGTDNYSSFDDDEVDIFEELRVGKVLRSMCINHRGIYCDCVLDPLSKDQRKENCNVYRNSLIKLASVCRDAIDRSDTVLAWIEEGAYGTAVEIGYAVGKGKRVVVAGPGVADRDLWFLCAVATDQIIRSPNPVRFVEDYLRGRYNKETFGSPIERSMFTALKPLLSPRLEVISQYRIGQYRVDIAIFGASGAKVVVECDGHEFHEKTKEQAASDKKRDRFLQSEGWKVLRFTGSEIYNKLATCVDEVVQITCR